MAQATDHAQAYSTRTTEALLRRQTLLSDDRRALSLLKKTELADELKLRQISHTGRKDELITRIIEDNERRRASDMQEILRTQRNAGNEELESAQNLAAANEKLQAELEGLKTQVRLLSATGNGQPGQAGTQRHDIRQIDAETIESDVHGWITETERIASLANWSPSLTLVNAITRLRGPARDWHASYGR
ncbi:hypothetical protein HPB50_012817 [Hyalomma asiaticum]|uniref:Uncharacterized protein n=1 Tax=Hyalomma asiaticum TaxID=266040 RepID=A0ACB7RP38_HYAAI|nr:hypothetical protein HPB50_012817 [Hyalomma asiaticum]